MRCRTAGLLALTWILCGLLFYELTAKTPHLTGMDPPGRWAANLAERTTAWQPPTGVHPLDKLLHEGEEAARFYAALAGFRPRGPGHRR